MRVAKLNEKGKKVERYLKQISSKKGLKGAPFHLTNLLEVNYDSSYNNWKQSLKSIHKYYKNKSELPEADSIVQLCQVLEIEFNTLQSWREVLDSITYYKIKGFLNNLLEDLDDFDNIESTRIFLINQAKVFGNPEPEKFIDKIFNEYGIPNPEEIRKIELENQLLKEKARAKLEKEKIEQLVKLEIEQQHEIWKEKIEEEEIAKKNYNKKSKQKDLFAQNQTILPLKQKPNYRFRLPDIPDFFMWIFFGLAIGAGGLGIVLFIIYLIFGGGKFAKYLVIFIAIAGIVVFILFFNMILDSFWYY